MTRSILLCIVLAAMACGSESKDSFQHYANKEQAYSIAQPDGWQVAAANGFAQLSPKSDQTKRKHTIMIRSAEKPREIAEGRITSNEDVVAATARVLRGLPRANVSAPNRIEGAELSGARFSLSFVPRGMTSRYRREHAVLVGAHHIYHVIYTSPANEPIDEASFVRVVATLTEEG